MCLAQRPQHSDANEARTRSFSVSSQALNHWATALPLIICFEINEGNLTKTWSFYNHLNTLGIPNAAHQGHLPLVWDKIFEGFT